MHAPHSPLALFVKLAQNVPGIAEKVEMGRPIGYQSEKRRGQGDDSQNAVILPLKFVAALCGSWRGRMVEGSPKE
jgi:hypothetical protein